jgi:arylsulfatase
MCSILVKISAVLLATVLVGATGCGQENDRTESGTRDRPLGVIVVLIDALRADHLGAYGSTRPLTPNLDAIAARSDVFENAWTTSSWTGAAVAALFTSRYPSTVGFGGRFSAMPDAIVTVAELLAANGLECAAISTNSNAGAFFGFAQGFRSFEAPKLRRKVPGSPYPLFPAEGVTDAALEWLRNRTEHGPFFLFLHYVDPHDPYLAPPGMLAEPEPPGRFGGHSAQLWRLAKTPPSERRQADLDRIRYLYAAEVKYTDVWIGKLIEGLETLGLGSKILLVITADHGEELFDHGATGHGKHLYEEMLRVPLLISWPGMTERDGRRIAEPVSLIDVAPTILAAWGIAPPGEFRGHDLGSPGRDSRRASGGRVYAEMDLDGVSKNAIRIGSAKLIRSNETTGGGRYELYDLATDPGETRDLSREKPHVLGQLMAALREQEAANSISGGQDSTVPIDSIDPEIIEQLHALGYVSDEEYRRFGERRGQAATGEPAAHD